MDTTKQAPKSARAERAADGTYADGNGEYLHECSTCGTLWHTPRASDTCANCDTGELTPDELATINWACAESPIADAPFAPTDEPAATTFACVQCGRPFAKPLRWDSWDMCAQCNAAERLFVRRAGMEPRIRNQAAAWLVAARDVVLRATQ
jgi:hypothetical protein